MFPLSFVVGAIFLSTGSLDADVALANGERQIELSGPNNNPGESGERTVNRMKRWSNLSTLRWIRVETRSVVVSGRSIVVGKVVIIDLGVWEITMHISWRCLMLLREITIVPGSS